MPTKYVSSNNDKQKTRTRDLCTFGTPGMNEVVVLAAAILYRAHALVHDKTVGTGVGSHHCQIRVFWWTDIFPILLKENSDANQQAKKMKIEDYFFGFCIGTERKHKCQIFFFFAEQFTRTPLTCILPLPSVVWTHWWWDLWMWMTWPSSDSDWSNDEWLYSTPKDHSTKIVIVPHCTSALLM